MQSCVVSGRPLQGPAKKVQEYSLHANPDLWLIGAVGMSKCVVFIL